MINRPFCILTLGRPLLLGLLSATLATGCSRPEQPNATPQTPSVIDTATPNSPPMVTSDQPSQSRALATKTTLPQTAPKVSKPLNLSRGTHLESLEQSDEVGTNEPSNLLPDLFKDQSRAPGARASGRLLMNETEKASMQAIDGMEFKLEIPVN